MSSQGKRGDTLRKHSPNLLRIGRMLPPYLLANLIDLSCKTSKPSQINKVSSKSKSSVSSRAIFCAFAKSIIPLPLLDTTSNKSDDSSNPKYSNPPMLKFPLNVQPTGY